jgi:hypothetical protein
MSALPALSGASRLRLLGAVAVLFGVATVFAGARALFGDAAARAAAGNVVGFVLWFNFAAGPAYFCAGMGLWRRRRWAVILSAAIALATAGIAAAFAAHVAQGGAHEPRTIAALALRRQPCSPSYFAISSSGVSAKSGFGTMQSAGHTSMHCGSSSAPTHSVQRAGSIT